MWPYECGQEVEEIVLFWTISQCYIFVLATINCYVISEIQFRRQNIQGFLGLQMELVFAILINLCVLLLLDLIHMSLKIEITPYSENIQYYLYSRYNLELSYCI